MNYKILFFLFLFIFSCKSIDAPKNIVYEKDFSNTGFTLVLDKKLVKTKKISKSLDERSLLIFQKNLTKNTFVKITNLLNNKSVIAQVSSDSKYPAFYNSVITKRISEEIELNLDEPYIEIISISQNSTFIAQKAKTFEEEKKVADKAPVEGITIKSIGISDSDDKPKKIKQTNFVYIIKIADFYFENTALLLKKRIINEFNIVNKVKIRTLSKTKYRVYLGPYKNLDSLKKGFNSISKLEFENIEIIKQ